VKGKRTQRRMAQADLYRSTTDPIRGKEKHDVAKRAFSAAFLGLHSGVGNA